MRDSRGPEPRAPCAGQSGSSAAPATLSGLDPGLATLGRACLPPLPHAEGCLAVAWRVPLRSESVWSELPEPLLPSQTNQSWPGEGGQVPLVPPVGGGLRWHPGASLPPLPGLLAGV